MLIKAYEEDCTSCSNESEWHKSFSQGHQNVEDDEHPGWPSTSKTEENVEKISQIIQEDCRLSVRKIAKMVNGDKLRESTRKKRPIFI